MNEPKITVVAEHSVCLELLPEKAIILDAGCLGFEFTHEMRALGKQFCWDVYPIDINPNLMVIEGTYANVGLGHKGGMIPIKRSSDLQATKLDWNAEGNTELIPVWTLDEFKEFWKIASFDLIKLDIEGEEYEVLKQAKHPISHQVSVEFHAHCTNQTRESLDELLSWLTQWYTIHGKCWEKRHGCSENYWDILLLAK